jgi:hypothetical protein
VLHTRRLRLRWIARRCNLPPIGSTASHQTARHPLTARGVSPHIGPFQIFQAPAPFDCLRWRMLSMFLWGPSHGGRIQFCHGSMRKNASLTPIVHSCAVRSSTATSNFTQRWRSAPWVLPDAFTMSPHSDKNDG